MTFDHCWALKGIGMTIERVLLMGSSQTGDHYSFRWLQSLFLSLAKQMCVIALLSTSSQSDGYSLDVFAKSAKSINVTTTFLMWWINTRYIVVIGEVGWFFFFNFYLIGFVARGYQTRGNCPRDLQAISCSRCWRVCRDHQWRHYRAMQGKAARRQQGRVCCLHGRRSRLFGRWAFQGFRELDVLSPLLAVEMARKVYNTNL